MHGGLENLQIAPVAVHLHIFEAVRMDYELHGSRNSLAPCERIF